MTREEFDKVVAFVEGAFGADLPDKQRDAWWILLHLEPVGAVMERAARLARSERARFGMLRPGELTAAAEAESHAPLAWATLAEVVEKHGRYASVTFVDPILSATVTAMGGWLAVCDLPLSDPTEARFIQRDFERLYVVLAQRGTPGPEKHLGELGERRRLIEVGRMPRGLTPARAQRLIEAGQES